MIVYFLGATGLYIISWISKNRGKKSTEHRVVTKQKVPQSPISFSMHPHIFGKHAMKSEPLGMNSTYFFSVYNTLPQCKIGQDKLGMGHFVTLTNSHCMDSSSEHFKSGCQFSLTTMENKTIARTFSTITCAPLWTYLVFHVLRINFRENGPWPNIPIFSRNGQNLQSGSQR